MPPETDPLLDPPLVRAAYADRTAWIMAACSALAYVRAEDGTTQAKQLSDALSGLRLNLVSTFNRGGTQGYLARNNRFAVLAFRGTEKDWRDILADLKIRFLRDNSGARIHDGFSTAYAKTAPDVNRVLAQLEPELPLYITGHSLGGAIAAIASMRIHPSDRIAACYTFGCPRVGDGEFVLQLWKVPVYRLVHAADIVTRVPLPVGGYRHAGDFRYIKRRGDLVQSPGAMGRFLGFTFTLATRFKRIFEDHRIAEYRDNLENWARKRQETPEAGPPPPPPTKAQAAAG